MQGGSVSAPFTGTAYRVKYLKPIPKEINHDNSTPLNNSTPEFLTYILCDAKMRIT